MKAFLDTHALVGLFEGDRAVFGPSSLDLIDESALFYSPMVRLELRFLERIGRLTLPAAEIVATVERELAVRESVDPFGAVVDLGATIDWTRDPFDVLIVATAMLHRAPLISKDAVIRANFPDAVW